MAKSIYSKQFNYGNLLKENYTLYLGPTKSPDIVLGCSFDMNDANSPRATGLFLKNITEIKDKDNDETESDPQSYTYEITKVQNVEEELFKFSLHFAGSYGIVSGSLDYTKTEEYFKQSDIFYLNFEAISNAETIKDITEIEFTNEPKAEHIKDIDKRFQKFNAHQGSHFVRTIYYGSRIVIRAKCDKDEKKLSENLEIALKVIGSAGSGEGKLTKEHKETIKNSKVEISISVMGRLITPNNEFASPIFRVIDYETVFNLIEEIRKGEAKIISCPIKCELETYKYILDEYPNCEELFTLPIKSTIAKSPFGVPSGTIISWIPSRENCRIDDVTGNIVEIYAPEGWAICDNNNLDFNLDGHFLRGVTKFEDVKTTGGKDSHSHRVKTPQPITVDRGATYGDGLDGGGVDFHPTVSFNLETSDIDGRPPFFNVIYIIKI